MYDNFNFKIVYDNIETNKMVCVFYMEDNIRENIQEFLIHVNKNDTLFYEIHENITEDDFVVIKINILQSSNNMRLFGCSMNKFNYNWTVKELSRTIGRMVDFINTYNRRDILC